MFFRFSSCTVSCNASRRLFKKLHYDSLLEPAAHGMGAPQAFQMISKMPTQKPDFGLKTVSVHHFTTSNRNGKKIRRVFRGAESIKPSNVIIKKKVWKIFYVSVFFNLASKSQAKRYYPRTPLIRELVTDLLMDEKRLRREKPAILVCSWSGCVFIPLIRIRSSARS